jgi:hypothetical protein
MNRKVPSRLVTKSFTIVFIVFGIQALFYCEKADTVLAQQASTSATATQVPRATGRPSSVDIKKNMLLQQQASITQSITVAKTCIKNNSMTQVLRDPDGIIRIVPSTDLVNCTRTLNQLLNLLASNQKALNNLSQDSQLESSRIITNANKNKVGKRLQIMSGGL